MQTKKCSCGKQAKKGDYCYACAKARTRAKDPIKAAYFDLRTNAKRRGKVFKLTLAQFRKFAIETEYCTKRGRLATSYHIDRKDETKGYTINNIQVLTNSDNVRKYLKFKERDENGRVHFEVITDKHFENINAPF